MARWRLGFVLIGVALILGTSQGLAFQPTDDAKVFEVSLRETPPLMVSDDFTATKDVNQALNDRLGGTWHVYMWSTLADTPEWVYGSGVELAAQGLANDAAAKEVATRFVVSNGDLLRANPTELEVAQVVRGMGKVGVHFAQRYHGVPVVGGRVSAIFGETGRLYVFGSTFFRNIAVNSSPALTGAAAEARARADLPFNPETDRTLTSPELAVLPVPSAEGGVEYHLVWRVTVGTSEPYGAWVTDVDAHTGVIVQRVNDVHSVYSGSSTGTVDPAPGYCANNPQTFPLSDMTINVSGIGSTTTDASGNFSIAGTGGNRTVTAAFDGPLVDVNDVQFPAAAFSGTIQENVPFNINWTDATPSRRSERDAFYWINKTNAFIWTIPKHTTSVNVNSSCNANWTTWHMNFFREGGGCANTGIIADVMSHEYGHGIQHSLIGGQGGQGLGEGNGDCTGTFLIDDSVIGRGFNLNNCTIGIRDCENTLVYPADVINQEVHAAGRVICGFNWDTRQALEASMGSAAGKAYAAELWHFSRKLLIPTTQLAQVLGYFTVDDDDNNLSNGTPNYDQICEGATNHEFPCPEIVIISIAHTPLPSTLDHSNPFTVLANIASTDAAIDIAQMSYRINGGAYTVVNMTNLRGGNTYTADIPAQAQDVFVDYYIYAHDGDGHERTDPLSAPTVPHQFAVGTLIDNLEAASGWVVGAAGDNATTGVWLRADPVGTSAQPEDDHTPTPGVMCFVTGNGPVGGDVGVNDVDNGTTTLLSPTFNLSAATQSCIVSYWRWYSNNQGGAPNTDNWVVDISNDGGTTWVSAENVNPPNAQQNTWVRVDVNVIALFGTPNQVKLRFRASDLGTGSIVEAAVDDLVVLTSSGTTGIEGPAAAAPVRFTVGPSQPNPFNPSTTLTYSLPSQTEVSVTVYDAAGRVVRELSRKIETAGEHAISWDGRDSAGATMSSGVYHIRVEAAGQAGTQKIVLLK
jgi:hypothetical protein